MSKRRSKWRNFVWWLPVGIFFGFLGSRISKLIKEGGLGAMGSSEVVALAVGTALVFLALVGIVAVINAHKGAFLMDSEQVEELRERGGLLLYSFIWMAASGLLLLVLSLAVPGGVLSPLVALIGALVLIAVLIVVGIATWRLSDELLRTLSYETGNMAFYFILVLGGGWAMLAHFDLVVALAPLDWLTLFTILPLVTSVIATGRRKLLTR